jgi:hypothetical protein
MDGRTPGAIMQVVHLDQSIVRAKLADSTENAGRLLDKWASQDVSIAFQVHVASGMAGQDNRPGRFKVALLLFESIGDIKQTEVQEQLLAVFTGASPPEVDSAYISPVLRVQQQDFRWFACTLKLRPGVRKAVVIMGGVSDYNNRAGAGMGPHFAGPCMGFLPGERIPELNAASSQDAWKELTRRMDEADKDRHDAMARWMAQCKPETEVTLSNCPARGVDGLPMTLVRTSAIGHIIGAGQQFDDFVDLTSATDPGNTSSLQYRPLQKVGVTSVIKTIDVEDAMANTKTTTYIGGIVSSVTSTYGGNTSGLHFVRGDLANLAVCQTCAPIRRVSGAWGITWAGLDRLDITGTGPVRETWDALSHMPVPQDPHESWDSHNGRPVVVARHSTLRLREEQHQGAEEQPCGYFEIRAPEGFCVAGFHGCEGRFIHGIGVYLAPTVPRRVPAALVSLGGTSLGERTEVAAWARRHLPLDLRRAVGQLMVCFVGLSKKSTSANDWSWVQVVPTIVDALVDQCYYSFGTPDGAGYTPIQWQ